MTKNNDQILNGTRGDTEYLCEIVVDGFWSLEFVILDGDFSVRICMRSIL